jgi:Ca2+-binding RTX toxin-like protein
LTMKGLSTPARFLALGLYAALIIPIAAHATDAPVIVNNDENFLYIKGGQAANRLSVALDRSTSEFVVTSNVAMTVLLNCHAVSATEVRCSRLPADNSLRADLGEGDDRMTLTAASHPGSVFGGSGADTIAAGLGRNVIGGGDGNDVLKGGAGNDRILGDRGRDAIFGGSGNDRLRADDGAPDAVIDCGPGEDAVRIDPTDPAPRRCERVHFEDGR